jgi:hypothetical protein
MFYNLRQKQKFELQIELSDFCNSRCPACSRFRDTRDGLIPPKSVDRHQVSFFDFKNWFSPSFLKERVFLIRINGSYGDSSLCKDIHKIIEYIGECNPNIELSMSTNGGTHYPGWWEELGKVFSKIPNSKLTFAIDGLQDTLSLYRVGVDYKTVISNAKAFIRGGGTAEWRMLVFKHNEDQIEKCKSLSKIYGFKYFCHRPTAGFIDSNNTLQYTWEGKHVVLEPGSNSKNVMKLGSPLTPTDVRCAAVDDGKGGFVNEMIIDSRGVVHPCCYFSHECRRVYKEFYETGDPNSKPKKDEYHRRTNMYYNSVANLIEDQGGIKSISLYHSTWDEIMNSPFYRERLERSWKMREHNGDLSMCGYMCSKEKEVHEGYHETGTGGVMHPFID